MRNPMQRLLLALAAGLFVGCQLQGEPPSVQGVAVDTAAIRASIDSLGAVVMRAHDTGDAELFASTWAEDGMMSVPGSPPVRSRDAIVANFRSRPPLPPGATMTIHPTEIQALSAEWAYVLGSDTLRYTPSGATEPVEETFSFLVLVRKTAEGWQTYREVLSANQPPSAPSP